MKYLDQEVQVAIIDKDKNEIIKIYPHMVKGDFEKITDEVMTWYYQQGCDKENRMEHYVVDILD